jgi:hypothetical protein
MYTHSMRRILYNNFLSHWPSQNLEITDVLSHYTPLFLQYLMNAEYLIST